MAKFQKKVPVKHKKGGMGNVQWSPNVNSSQKDFINVKFSS